MAAKNGKKSATAPADPLAGSDPVATPVTKRGGNSLNVQIAKLVERVGPEGDAAANEILARYSPDVIRLAFKRIPDPVVALSKELSKAELATLALIPDETAREAARTAMLARRGVAVTA